MGLLVSACTQTDPTTPPVSDEEQSVPTSAATATTSRDCAPDTLAATVDLPADPVDAALKLTQASYSCVPVVVVADLAALPSGAEQALELGAPLLVTEADRLGDVVAEVDRLNPDRVIYIAQGDGGTANNADVPSDWERATPSGPVQSPVDMLSTAGTGEAREREGAPLWVVSEGLAATGVAVLPTLTTLGGRVMLSDQPSDVDPADLGVIGPTTATERWQLLAQSHAAELPGGGITLFPGRRIVAYYGSPVTFRLGILGERNPQATIEQLQALTEEYVVAGGPPVIPAFELIVTVADSKPGDDNDYSNELTPGQVREWVDIATENDAMVILDLQPGRTDFLTQAKRYEDLLRLPNVGLALDPEWRLEPDEVHLQQIGSVDAEEINEVVEWLSQLVREETLPQKLLVLHQFNLDMITNRELVNTPPELAVVVHVDGQGPLFSKYGTYETVLGAPIGPDQTLWWGWKNFIDEDFPTATPAQTNAVDPLPMVVTFQ